MIRIAYTLIITSVFIVQTTFLHFFSFYGFQPDLILVTVLYFAIKSDDDKGVYLGAFLGLVQDILSSGLLGLNFFTKGLIALLVSDLRDNVMTSNLPTRLTLIFASAVFEGLLTLLIFKVFLPQEAVFRIFSGFVLGRALYCSLSGVFLMGLFDLVGKGSSRNLGWSGYGSRK
jgi:rod shape-determining protein MreD